MENLKIMFAKNLLSNSIYVLLMCYGKALSYTPITWINGAPHNIYKPLCLVGAYQKDAQSRFFHLDANAVALSQWSRIAHITSNSQLYGLAIQGTMNMDQLLSGLYSNVYVAALINHEKTYDSIWRAQYHYEAGLADTHLQLGWKAYNKEKAVLSCYAFGIIPATKHALFDATKTINWVGLDAHFAWGIGANLQVRLKGNTVHHCDWLTDVNVTFLESCHTKAWVKNNGFYELYPIKIYAHQLYKFSTTLAYQYKKFISDIGVHFFYMPSLNYTRADNISQVLEPADYAFAPFCDVGATFPSRKLSYYCSVGAQATCFNHGSNYWGANLKGGVHF